MERPQGGLYRPLSDHDVRRVHEGVIEVLSTVGVDLYEEGLRRLMVERGAKPEGERRVRIPRSVLERALETAPSRVVLCGREERFDAVLEGTNVYFGPGGTAINVLDPITGRRRPSTTLDVAGMAKLTQALDQVDVFTINVFPNDIRQPENVDVNRFYWSLKYTSKHVQGGVYSFEGACRVMDMAERIAGSPQALRDRPFVSMIALVISPLKIDPLYGRIAAQCARGGIPVVVPTEPICGTTCPITLAASIVMHCAESLAGVVLVQAVNPGSPVLFGSVGSITNLRTMSHVGGAVERGIINAAVAQMAQFYRLPLYSTGGCTDAKVVDAQAGYESAMMNLLVSMAGANYIHDAVGLMDLDLTASYEKMVLDNDVLGMCRRVLRGIEVNDDTLAIDLIRQVGPGGQFADSEHTVAQMRKEFHFTDIADRQVYERWVASGAMDARQRAGEWARGVLLAPNVTLLEESVDAELRRRFPEIVEADPRELCRQAGAPGRSDPQPG